MVLQIAIKREKGREKGSINRKDRRDERLAQLCSDHSKFRLITGGTCTVGIQTVLLIPPIRSSFEKDFCEGSA